MFDPVKPTNGQTQLEFGPKLIRNGAIEWTFPVQGMPQNRSSETKSQRTQTRCTYSLSSLSATRVAGKLSKSCTFSRSLVLERKFTMHCRSPKVVKSINGLCPFETPGISSVLRCGKLRKFYIFFVFFIFVDFSYFRLKQSLEHSFETVTKPLRLHGFLA